MTNIREMLPITGKQVVLVTCDDWEDVVKEHPDPHSRVSSVYIHFSDGSTLSFFVTSERGFTYDGYEDENTCA